MGPRLFLQTTFHYRDYVSHGYGDSRGIFIKCKVRMGIIK